MLSDLAFLSGKDYDIEKDNRKKKEKDGLRVDTGERLLEVEAGIYNKHNSAYKCITVSSCTK